MRTDVLVKVDDEAGPNRFSEPGFVSVYVAGENQPVAVEEGDFDKVFDYESKSERRDARQEAEAYAKKIAEQLGCKWATNY